MKNVFIIALLFIVMCSPSNNKTVQTIQTMEQDLMLIVHSHQVNLSSNQHDYISSHAKEFNRLVSSKELGLSYLLKQFESKEQNSLKEYIMATVCVEILGNENKGKEWSTGREWYMDYKKTTT